MTNTLIYKNKNVYLRAENYFNSEMVLTISFIDFYSKIYNIIAKQVDLMKLKYLSK